MTEYVKVPLDWVRDVTRMLKEWNTASNSASHSRLRTVSGLILPAELSEDWTPAEGGGPYTAKAKKLRFDENAKAYSVMENEDEITIHDPFSGEEKPSSQVGDRVGVVYRGRWEIVGVPSSVSIHVGTVSLSSG